MVPLALNLKYYKSLKTGTPRMITVNPLEWNGLVLLSNNAAGMTSSADPDQTASFGAV